MYLEMLQQMYGAALEKQAMEKKAITLPLATGMGSLGAILGSAGAFAANPNASKKKLALTGGLTGGLTGIASIYPQHALLKSISIGPKTGLLASLGLLASPAIGGYLAEKIRSRGANN